MKVGYRAARIIDGRKNQPYLKSVLILDGEKIEGVVPEAEISKDLMIVELGDSTILPGLIDSHVHLVDDGTALYRNMVENESHGLTLLRSAKRAFTSLCSGITTLRDMGAPSGILPCLKDAVNFGVVTGPTIITCDTELIITGEYGRKKNVLGREVDGLDEMRKAVREIIRNGGDFIKIFASGHASVAGSIPGREQFSREELSMAVEEAHRAGKKVAVHAIWLNAIESSIRVGVDCIEHGNFLTPDLAKEMADKGIFFNPTLLPVYLKAHPSREIVLSKEILGIKPEDRWKATLNALHIAKEAGVKIGAGTDSGGGGILHNSLINELELMVLNGFSPMEAIMSATRINTEMLGLSEIGLLEKAKLADVLVVEGDPLVDIKALIKVKMVLKNGKEILENPQIFSGVGLTKKEIST